MRPWRLYGPIGIGGSLADQKASFSIRFNGYSSFETPNLNAALPTGTVSQALALRTPTTSGYVNGLLDYALTTNQTLRLSFTEQDNGSDNLGVGAFDLPDRAFSTRYAPIAAFACRKSGPSGDGCS